MTRDIILLESAVDYDAARKGAVDRLDADLKRGAISEVEYAAAVMETVQFFNAMAGVGVGYEKRK